MKRNRLIQLACLAVLAVGFAACSQEELSSPTELVEGAYPLQIATGTIADGQPSPRVTGNEGRMGSTWEVGDRIYVKFEGRDEVGILSITDAATGAVEIVEPIYWTSQSATVIAWHTSTGSRGGMDVSDQTGGIAYMVGCKAQAPFGEEANLTLSHRLSKVRVYIDGVDSPTSVAMVYPSGFTITEGEISPSEQNNTILMYPTTVNGKACYEATVAPGAMATSTNSIIVMQGTIKHEIFLDNNLTLEAVKVNKGNGIIKGWRAGT